MICSFKGKYAFLSNFHPSPIRLPGYNLIFPSAEHAYQAMKYAHAPMHFNEVLQANTPGKAKRLGRKYPMDPSFDSVETMYKIVRAKFLNNPELACLLLETGNEELVEGNTWNDTTWGVDLSTGKGLNQLGKILMLVRDECQSLKADTRGS